MLLLTACGKESQWQAAPPQYRFAPDLEPPAAGTVVSMRYGDADRFIVSGVLPGPPGQHHRWTNKRAELKFLLREPVTTLTVDIGIAEQTLRDTGPVTIRFLVNGQEVGRERYDKEGTKRFHTQVLLPKGETRLAMEIDKVWRAPSDGVELGFLLIQAGFR